jgi:hypothetical protein
MRAGVKGLRAPRMVTLDHQRVLGKERLQAPAGVARQVVTNPHLAAAVASAMESQVLTELAQARFQKTEGAQIVRQQSLATRAALVVRQQSLAIRAALVVHQQSLAIRAVLLVDHQVNPAIRAALLVDHQANPAIRAALLVDHQANPAIGAALIALQANPAIEAHLLAGLPSLRENQPQEAGQAGPRASLQVALQAALQNRKVADRN